MLLYLLENILPVTDQKTEVMSVKVKIGDILDPRTCWAYETENTERQNKLKLMQKEMKQQWQNSPEIAIKSIAELHRVIILRQEEFCRGELKNVSRTY